MISAPYNELNRGFLLKEVQCFMQLLKVEVGGKGASYSSERNCFSSKAIKANLRLVTVWLFPRPLGYRLTSLLVSVTYPERTNRVTRPETG